MLTENKVSDRKRACFTTHGGSEVLRLVSEELADPAPNEVMIKHEAIGVNFVETYFRSGLYHTPLPSGLGTEAVGKAHEYVANRNSMGSTILVP